MSRKQTDRDWEQWGKSNPYFGVISDPKFLGRQITSVAKQEFFNSGKAHTEGLFRTINSLVGNSFKAKTGLDFGCGVGRITQALAGHCDSVTGIDISPSMIKEAWANLPRKLKPRVKFGSSEDELACGRQFDLIHSFIVLQHIPKKSGYQITRRLLEKTSPGGVVALHYTIATHVSRFERNIQLIRYHFPPAHYGLNILRGKSLKEPMMHMYDYNLNRLLIIFQEFGMTYVNLEITRHGDYSGAFIIARKPIHTGK